MDGIGFIQPWNPGRQFYDVTFRHSHSKRDAHNFPRPRLLQYSQVAGSKYEVSLDLENSIFTIANPF